MRVQFQVFSCSSGAPYPPTGNGRVGLVHGDLDSGLCLKIEQAGKLGARDG